MPTIKLNLTFDDDDPRDYYSCKRLIQDYGDDLFNALSLYKAYKNDETDYEKEYDNLIAKAVAKALK